VPSSCQLSRRRTVPAEPSGEESSESKKSNQWHPVEGGGRAGEEEGQREEEGTWDACNGLSEVVVEEGDNLPSDVQDRADGMDEDLAVGRDERTAEEEGGRELTRNFFFWMRCVTVDRNTRKVSVIPSSSDE
jgi:hypothetical protein